MRAHLKLWDSRCVVQEVAATVPSATDDSPPPTRLMDVCGTLTPLYGQHTGDARPPLQGSADPR
jgi:hypothetical protein